jgi:hypothetical protein
MITDPISSDPSMIVKASDSAPQSVPTRMPRTPQILCLLTPSH